MKTNFKPAFFFLLIAIVATFGCKKAASTKPTNNLSLLNGSWNVSAWGGVAGNYIDFTISESTGIGTVTFLDSQPFGFVVGDKLFTDIVYTSAGKYSATGKYTYGTDNTSSGTRAVILTLQNNNTQLTADYPAINSDFPELIYVFQQGTVTALWGCNTVLV